jgi:hypothetical protein
VHLDHADARLGGRLICGQVEALQRDVAGVMGLQEEQGRLLAEILRRLPARPE